MHFPHLVEVCETSRFDLQRSEESLRLLVGLEDDDDHSRLHHLSSRIDDVARGDPDSLPVDDNLLKPQFVLVLADVALRVDIDHRAVVGEEYVLIGDSEAHCGLLVSDPHEQLSVRRHEVLWLDQVDHDLLLFLRGMSARVDIHPILREEGGPQLDELVHEIDDASFVSGDRIRGEDDIVPRPDLDDRMLSVRHPVQAREFLSLASGGKDDDLVIRNGID